MILGVDTGGTFTDFVLHTQANTSLLTHKVLSTPEAPEQAILQGIAEMGLAQEVSQGNLKIVHGSTVATNAALEGKGVRTAFITNQGFKDMLTIGRQVRPHLYQLETAPQKPPVETELCLEIPCRIDSQGNVLQDLLELDLSILVNQLNQLKPEAIAINLLFSFLNSDHEQQIEEYLSEHLHWRPYICRSSSVLPEYKEYERGITTWLNACLGPLVKDYLLQLESQTKPSPLSIMQSSGGTIGAKQASQKAVNLLLSGPAGGLAATSFLAKALDQPHIITFDMGGTSSDVALISNGKINLTNEGKIGNFPVSVPMVDLHTIGAGGGSIAYVDDGGLLQVGPQSAGAKPGPACYGQGGTSATVTDANLVLGRLLPDAFLGGGLTLNKNLSIKSLQEPSSKLSLTSEETAEGIIEIANEHMARALRAISIERGYEPKAFRLCCFGGAGGLHVCALADALEMDKAVLPLNAGVFSALGMIVAPIERQLSRTYQCLLNDADIDELQQIIDALNKEARNQVTEEFNGSITLELSFDLRYYGQSAHLNIASNAEQNSLVEELKAGFNQAHAERYGHRLNESIEMVNIRVAARAQKPQLSVETILLQTPAEPIKTTILYGYDKPVPVYQRESLALNQVIRGPALIIENNSTSLIESAWQSLVDGFGNLILDKVK